MSQLTGTLGRLRYQLSTDSQFERFMSVEPVAC